MSGFTPYPPSHMDGPNFEEVFRRMQCLHGGNAEDVKIIVRYLRFFRDQEGYETYLKHYLPMLPEEIAKEFVEVKELPKAEDVIPEPVVAVVEETVVEETAVGEIAVEPTEPTEEPLVEKSKKKKSSTK